MTERIHTKREQQTYDWFIIMTYLIFVDSDGVIFMDWSLFE